MFTLLTIALWIGGLFAMLAGHMVIGACVAAAGVLTAPQALRRKDDMPTAFGIMLMFILAVGAIRVVAFLLRAVGAPAS